MKRGLWLGGLVLIGTVWLASGEPQDPVAAAAQEWARHFSDPTPDALLALYDREAVLWGTTSPELRADPAAIRQYFVTTFEALPKRKVTFGQQLIRVYGDTAINTGLYTFEVTNREGKSRTFPSRYSFTYVKRDGKWMIVDHHSSRVRPRTIGAREFPGLPH